MISRAVSHPGKRKLLKLSSKHKTSHKSSLGHKDQIKKGCQNFWRGHDVIFDQIWSYGDRKISIFKNACFVGYFRENLMLIIFQIKIASKAKDFWDNYNLGQKVGEIFTKLGKICFSMECFRGDFLQFFTKKRHNLAFGCTAGYWPSYPSISGIFLKFPNFWVLSRSVTRGATRTFTFCW